MRALSKLCLSAFQILLFILVLLFICEFLIYYLAILQCTWPEIRSNLSGTPLKVMVLADTHLLGPRKGHWFDKLRREWQMHRAFQTVMTIHNPEVVFILGDLYDEGQFATSNEFQEFVDRFNYIFKHPPATKLYVVAGNHDLGFHYRMTYNKVDRFRKVFGAPSVKVEVIEGNIFVMVNSMALENDGCSLCDSAQKELERISLALRCRHNGGPCPKLVPQLPAGAKPILLQHFPMYRDSDSACEGEDTAPIEEKNVKFRQKWDCLSEESSRQLLQLLDPQLILSGHTHYGCFRLHPNSVPEWTISSFNWRNTNKPSFLLMSIIPEDVQISKCFIPQENTIIFTYIIAMCTGLLYLSLRKTCTRMCTSYRNKNR